MDDLSAPQETSLVTAVLSGSELRDVRVGGYRALDAIYVAVRDDAWSTIPGRVVETRGRQDDTTTLVTVRILHGAPSPVLSSQISVSAASNRLTYRLEGEVLADFTANRIGICLLHPLELIGTSFQASRPGGTLASRFSRAVTGHPLASGLSGLSYEPGPGAALELELVGEVFEMEDHRNWADSGWKTYCPPVAAGAGRRWSRGDTVAQAITLRARAAAPAQARRRPAAQHHEDEVHLVVAEIPDAVVPAIGLHCVPDNPQAAEAAAHASFTRVELVEGHQNEEDAAGFLAAAAASGRCVAVSLAYQTPGWLEDTAGIAGRWPAVRRVSAFGASSLVTGPEDAARVRAVLRSVGSSAQVGGGSRLHFAELNRLPHRLTDCDFVSFPVTAQAHHTGDDWIMDGLRSLPVLVEQARDLAGQVPVFVEPLSLRARPSPFAPPDPGDPVDERERGQFGGAWLLGCVTRLRHSAGIAVLADPDASTSPAPSPAMALLRTLARCRGAAMRKVSADPRRVVACALDRPGQRPLILAANLRSQPATVRLGAQTRELGGHELARMDS